MGDATLVASWDPEGVEVEHLDSFRANHPPSIVVDLDNDQDVLLKVAWLSTGSFFPAAVRRFFDTVLSLVGMIVLSPLILILVVLIKATSPGPAFYKHRRVGRYGVPFDCWKLRTMCSDADAALAKVLASDPELAAGFAMMHKLDFDPRVTPIGHWLRVLSLDELPQLWNVLRGEMSLVGPRPIVVAEFVRYGNALGSVLSVKPGMTGLWQVSGRSETTYEKRVELDLTYVAAQSMRFDLAIMAKTVFLLLRPDKNGAR